MADDDERLHDIFDSLARYSDENPFDAFKMRLFFKAGPAERTALLLDWDRRMEHETTPSRETAKLIAQRRELLDLHNLLKSANR